MANFEICNMSVPRGTLQFGKFPVGQWRGGLPAEIPVMVMHGAQDGPTIWIDACLHGNEVGNIEVIRRVMREAVTPENLAGTIVAVPVINPFAFHVGTRGTPLVYDYVDITDPHGLFPGLANGSLNDRLAYRVFNEMVKCEHIINLHQTNAPAVPFTGVPVVEDREIVEKSLAMAEAFGLPITETRLGGGYPIAPQGWPILSTMRRGIPTFLVELVSTGWILEPYVSWGTQGVLNVLRHLGMIAGEVQPQKGLKVPAGRYGRRFLMSNQGGIINFQKQAGDWVESGELIALVRDVYGDLVDEVYVPMQGYLRTLLHGRHNEAIYEGMIVASILERDPARNYFVD
jgi:predicted deacylase